MASGIGGRWAQPDIAGKCLVGAILISLQTFNCISSKDLKCHCQLVLLFTYLLFQKDTLDRGVHLNCIALFPLHPCIIGILRVLFWVCYGFPQEVIKFFMQVGKKYGELQLKPWNITHSMYCMLLVNVQSTVEARALYAAKPAMEDIDFAHLCDEKRLVVVKCNWLFFQKVTASSCFWNADQPA